MGGDAGCPIRGRGKLEGWGGGGGGACLSMKSASFLGSSEDTGNEISRKRCHSVLGIPIPISLAFWASPVGDAQNADRFELFGKFSQTRYFAL